MTKANLTSIILVVACGYGFSREARAHAAQLVPRCTADVAGRNGKNMEAEQVADALQAQGCEEGAIVRMSAIQPLRNAANGSLVGGGSYYRQLLCKDQPFTTDGPTNGVQVVTCTYNGSKATPGG